MNSSIYLPVRLPKLANPIPLILYPVMSLLTFALYAKDKSRAQQGDWRISERTLHLCELAGGWLGGFIAQKKLRHKSTKSSYSSCILGDRHTPSCFLGRLAVFGRDGAKSIFEIK